MQDDARGVGYAAGAGVLKEVAHTVVWGGENKEPTLQGGEQVAGPSGPEGETVFRSRDFSLGYGVII